MGAPFATMMHVASSLRSPMMVNLLRVVEANPAITIGRLRGALDVAWGTVYHTVHQLEARGHIETRQCGRRRIVFPAGRIDESLLASLSLLQGRTTGCIATTLLSQGPSTLDALVVDAARRRRTVYKTLLSLRAAGLVEIQGPLFQATDRMRECMRILTAWDIEPLNPTGPHGSPDTAP